MQGQFEIGSGGIKGSVEVDIFVEVLRKAVDSGFPADEALELASGATAPTGSMQSTSTGAVTVVDPSIRDWLRANTAMWGLWDDTPGSLD
jgi:hypothetical protein